MGIYSLEARQQDAFKNRELTNDLYHYTSADVALFNILHDGRLRMQPFQGLNDPWDAKPFKVGLTTLKTNEYSKDGIQEIWDGVYTTVKLQSKILCLTQDWDLPEFAVDSDALRGWRHLSLWAHYASGHTGVCLKFDRSKLLQELERVGNRNRGSLHGPVNYMPLQTGGLSGGIFTGWVEEYGLDVTAHEFAIKNREEVFFSKDRDWVNEDEYRMVIMSETYIPEHLDISAAVTGIYLGDSFPDSKVPSLAAIAKKYPNLTIHRIKYENRALRLLDVDIDAEVSALTPCSNRKFDENFQTRLQSIRDDNIFHKKYGGGPTAD